MRIGASSITARTATKVAALSSATLVLIGCTLLTKIDDDLSSGLLDAGDAGSEGGLSSVDGSSSADSASPDTGSADAAAGCVAATGGPSLVRIDPLDGAGKFCIDRTEVTRAQYVAFLASGGKSNHPRCAFKTSYTPGGPWPPNNDDRDLPVANVDWCDAEAFCSWAGKQLCGARSGGALAPSSANDITQSMLGYACSGGGVKVYPYGDTYDGKACNDREHDAGGPVAVATIPTCEGGFPGVFDLAGNVAEWMDACSVGAGAGDTDPCIAFNSPYYEEQPDELVCSHIRFDLPRNVRFDYIGFRCCSR